MAVSGRSLCSRGLVEHLSRAFGDGDLVLDVLLASPVGLAEPLAGVDVLVVCASECSGHDDPDVYRRAQEQYPNARLVAISPRAHAWNLVTALDMGAKGFIACGIDDISDIANALLNVLEGDIAFSDGVSRLVVSTLQRTGFGDKHNEFTPRPSSDLSQRELGVLTLLCDGLSNGQIANALGLSPNTIKNHLGRIYRKLGADSRGEAISVAMRQGLV